MVGKEEKKRKMKITFIEIEASEEELSANKTLSESFVEAMQRALGSIGKLPTSGESIECEEEV